MNIIYRLEELKNKSKDILDTTVFIVRSRALYDYYEVPGGYDHLGMLPPKTVTEFKGMDYYVQPVKVRFLTLEDLHDSIFFETLEDAQWHASLMQYKYDKEREEKISK